MRNALGWLRTTAQGPRFPMAINYYEKPYKSNIGRFSSLEKLKRNTIVLYFYQSFVIEENTLKWSKSYSKPKFFYQTLKFFKTSSMVSVASVINFYYQA